MTFTLKSHLVFRLGENVLPSGRSLLLHDNKTTNQTGTIGLLKIGSSVNLRFKWLFCGSEGLPMRVLHFESVSCPPKTIRKIKATISSQYEKHTFAKTGFSASFFVCSTFVPLFRPPFLK